MADQTSEILAQCIADIKAGKASIEDCLAKYSQLRVELEPLLKIALAIEPPPKVTPSPIFKTRARANLLAKIQPQYPVTKGRWLRYSFMTDLIPAERRLKMAAILIAIVVAVASVGGGTAYASQDALPGDMLYPEKTFIENARLFFAFSDQTKAETHLKIADTRIDELSKLPGDRNRFIERIMENYQYNLEQGLDLAEQLVEQGGNASGLLNKFQERITYHQGVLNTSCNQVQVEARHVVQNALNVSDQGLDRTNRMMAQVRMENTSRIMAQVFEAAQAGNVDEVDELLGDYDEELSAFMEVASATGDAEGLLEQAREGLGLVFQQMPAEIPEQARTAIENARVRTMEGIDHAAEAMGQGEGLMNAWQEFEREWEEFMYQWQGETTPGPENWQYAWDEYKQGQHEPGSQQAPSGDGQQNGTGSQQAPSGDGQQNGAGSQGGSAH